MENLKILEEMAASTQTYLQKASSIIGKIYSPNREISLVKTKIDEALMWLEKYQKNLR